MGFDCISSNHSIYRRIPNVLRINNFCLFFIADKITDFDRTKHNFQLQCRAVVATTMTLGLDPIAMNITVSIIIASNHIWIDRLHLCEHRIYDVEFNLRGKRKTRDHSTIANAFESERLSAGIFISQNCTGPITFQATKNGIKNASFFECAAL